MLARLNNPGDGRDDVRAMMHALKQTVIDNYRAGPDDAERRAQIKEILRQATEDIGKLA